MKNYEVINLLNGMDSISTLSFPIKITYAIKKNASLLLAEYKVYEEMLKEIEKDDKQKINELLNLEVEVKLKKFDEDALLSSDVDISIKQLNILEYMIKEGD